MVLRERILAGMAGLVFLTAGVLTLPPGTHVDCAGRAALTVAAVQPQKAPSTDRQSVLTYTVEHGDTLSEIAVRYGVRVEDLLRANRLAGADRLVVGAKLVIPTTPPVTGNPLTGGSRHSLTWPVSGPVSSPFGWRYIFGHPEFHTGVDIAAPPGTPIQAVLAGRVVFAGLLGGYGLTVVIDHGAGFNTLYAHAAHLLVQPGQTVAAGQTIALVGETGDATGPHLHFETRVDGRVQDPLHYLARRKGAGSRGGGHRT